MDNREEQIRLAEQLISTGIDGELKKAIENQFPELKESEDEKIRKVLLKYFNERNSYRDEDETFNGVPFPSIIAYLEKQKEQRSIEDVIKNITKNKEAATKFLKSAGIMDDNGELAEMYRSEKKPAEWSELDKLHQHNIIAYLEFRKDKNLPEDTKYPVLDAWIDWLKSLGPWPKEEWSEGIKKALNEISDYLKYHGREDDADFIRDLRPQPQWKPSEKQIRSLEKWLQDKRYDGDSRYVYPIFESLFNDLQKLL